MQLLSSLLKTVQARAQHDIWIHTNENWSEKGNEDTKRPSVIQLKECGFTLISPKIIKLGLSEEENKKSTKRRGAQKRSSYSPSFKYKVICFAESNQHLTHSEVALFFQIP